MFSIYLIWELNSIDISQAAVIQQYNNCWAATSATIINHKIGSNGPVMRYTAEMICDELGIGYNAGGSSYDMQRALSNHGIYYNVSRSKIQFSKFRSNIDSNKPVIINVSNGVIHHSVVGFGYFSSDAFYYDGDIYYFDPNGYFSSMRYGTGICNTAGYQLTWVETVYY